MSDAQGRTRAKDRRTDGRPSQASPASSGAGRGRFLAVLAPRSSASGLLTPASRCVGFWSSSSCSRSWEWCNHPLGADLRPHHRVRRRGARHLQVCHVATGASRSAGAGGPEAHCDCGRGRRESDTSWRGDRRSPHGLDDRHASAIAQNVERHGVEAVRQVEEVSDGRSRLDPPRRAAEAICAVRNSSGLHPFATPPRSYLVHEKLSGAP